MRYVLDVGIQFIHVDVGEEWTDDTTLRCPAEGRFIFPLINDARFQSHTDEIE